MPDLAELKLWLSSMSVRGAFDYVLVKLRSLGSRLKASFGALAKTSAVWSAVVCMFLGGFWLGHIEGAKGKRALKANVLSMQAEVDAKTRAVKLAEQGEARANEDAKAWRSKFEAAQADASAGAVKRAAPKKPPEARKMAARPYPKASPSRWPWE